ncbi:hypothetical protein [Lysinibacillus capsici]|uniref:hypothetical protein n=1 Tax=Lysinibacillus capsici TaxID=2115968 RepID=UPI000E20057C|nr:hypothetical protein [Lysinibacillus capsici]RDV27113.1 hypothetical protein C7B89_19950 [Lysinibacillus capsici]
MAYNANNITWNQLAQSLKDRLNIPTLELVNDLTTGGATKAASAETVKILNTNRIQHATKVATTTTLGHVKSSDTLTVDADGTAHAKQVEIVDNTIEGGRTKAASAETVKMLQSEVDSALKVNTYNANSTTINLGKTSARRVFPLQQFSIVDKSEQYALIFPNVNMYGVLKITATSTYGTVNAAGGCEINVLVGRTKDSAAILLDYNIVSMSPTFASNFLFAVGSTSSGVTITFDKKQGVTTLSVNVQYDTVYQDAYSVLQGVNPAVGAFQQINNFTPQQSIFTHVGNSKANLATAITGKGVATSADATFATMVANINAIPTGIKYYETTISGNVAQKKFNALSGSVITTDFNFITVTIPFANPSIIHVRSIRTGDYLAESYYTSFSDGYSTGTVKMTMYNNLSANTTTFNMKPYVTDLGNGSWQFDIPVLYYNTTYTVRAYE